METFIYLAAAAVLLGGVLAAVYVLSRRRSTGAPPTTSPGFVKGTHTDIEPPDDVLAQHDPDGGTSKISREDLHSLVGGESSVAEQAYFLVIAGEGIGRFIALERDTYTIGRDPGGADIRFRDDAVSQMHARVRMEDGTVVIEDLGSSNGTYVDGEQVQRTVLRDGARVVLGRSTVLTLTFQDQLGEEFQRKMYESSTRDGLTKAYNKETFLDQMKSELHFASRHGTNYCLVMLDIDHFKQINDTHGHVAGDDILRGVADVIRSVIRDEAMFVRYGGEEFIIGERNADIRVGLHIAERIRKALEEATFDTVAGPLKVTASLGVADLTVPEEKTTLALVGAADEALYEAKGAGRNQVKVAGET